MCTCSWLFVFLNHGDYIAFYNCTIDNSMQYYRRYVNTKELADFMLFFYQSVRLHSKQFKDIIYLYFEFQGIGYTLEITMYILAK